MPARVKGINVPNSSTLLDTLDSAETGGKVRTPVEEGGRQGTRPGKYGDGTVKRVEVWLSTGDVAGAGTDGQVYLVLGGREFNLKRSDINDRQQGATDHYILGQGANIEHKKENNPTGIPMHLVWDNELGLRFEPVAGLNPPDAWNLGLAEVSIQTVNGYEDWGTWTAR
jgi:hypothetical protein